MTDHRFTLSPWTADQTAVLEAWGHDRRAALQAGLDAALALMLGEDAQFVTDAGPVVPLRGEGDTVAALFSDLLDDLLAQVALHGPMRSGTLDGVLTRDRDGFVAWGYLHPQASATPAASFEQAGNVEAVVDTRDEVRLRVTLRRLA